MEVEWRRGLDYKKSTVLVVKNYLIPITSTSRTAVAGLGSFSCLPLFSALENFIIVAEHSLAFLLLVNFHLVLKNLI